MKSSTILQKVIKEIQEDPGVRNKDDDLVVVSEICKKIQSEENAKLIEKDRTKIEDEGPKGANIHLTLPVPYQKSPKEICYLTLENDPLTGWSVCYYVDFGNTGQNKLKRRHDIEATKPNHIMTNFAKIYKAYLGKDSRNL